MAELSTSTLLEENCGDLERSWGEKVKREDEGVEKSVVVGGVEDVVLTVGVAVSSSRLGPWGKVGVVMKGLS